MCVSVITVDEEELCGLGDFIKNLELDKIYFQEGVPQTEIHLDECLCQIDITKTLDENGIKYKRDEFQNYLLEGER